jgi:hypothetical protein
MGGQIRNGSNRDPEGGLHSPHGGGIPHDPDAVDATTRNSLSSVKP